MRYSQNPVRNPGIRDWTVRYQKRTNLQFFHDAFATLQKEGIGNQGLMTVGLVGSRDIPGHLLRMAQNTLRWDLRPSYWSHAFVVADRVTARTSLRSLRILEVALHPRNGQFPRPEQNGVNEGMLGHYEHSLVDANVALVAVAMSEKEAHELRQRARSWNLDRIRYNFWNMLAAWQAYVWLQHSKPNPLQEGVPIAASSYIEFIYERLGIEVTPGASSRSSAPEHLWNAACWWHKAFKEQGRNVMGMFVLRDPGCALLRTGEVK